MRGEGRPSVNEAKEGEGVGKTHALDIERPGFLGDSGKVVKILACRKIGRDDLIALLMSLVVRYEFDTLLDL